MLLIKTPEEIQLRPLWWLNINLKHCSAYWISVFIIHFVHVHFEKDSEKKTGKAKKMQKTHAMTQANTRKSVTLIKLLAKVSWVTTQQTFVLMKTSFVFVFRRRLDQGEHTRYTHTSSEDVFKTSSRRLDQDQYIRLGHTSSRRFQDVLPRCLQDVLQKRLHKYTDHKFLRSVT